MAQAFDSGAFDAGAFEATGGAGSQTVTQTAHFTNTAQFHAGQLGLGIIAPLLVGVSTFHAGSISQPQVIVQTLRAANDSLFYGGEVTGGVAPSPSAIGGGGSYQAAQHDWDRRQKWTREVKQWVEDSATPDTGAEQAPQATQAAQDAPRGARKPRPAPQAPAAPTPLDTLLYSAGQLPVAQLLADAMLRGMQDEMVLLAMRAERELQDEEDAIVVLLMGMA